jgi:catechol 2,3-dioxygenase-like lactoylglutathione lyase family enzyme
VVAVIFKPYRLLGDKPLFTRCREGPFLAAGKYRRGRALRLDEYYNPLLGNSCAGKGNPLMSTPAVHPDVHVGHVHLMVSDVDRSIAFYRDLLGFQVTYHSPDEPPYRLAFLAAGDYHHHIGLNSIRSQDGTPPPQVTPGWTTSPFSTPTARNWPEPCGGFANTIIPSGTAGALLWSGLW